MMSITNFITYGRRYLISRGALRYRREYSRAEQSRIER
jgi:hypothetical protein